MESLFSHRPVPTPVFFLTSSRCGHTGICSPLCYYYCSYEYATSALHSAGGKQDTTKKILSRRRRRRRAKCRLVKRNFPDEGHAALTCRLFLSNVVLSGSRVFPTCRSIPIFLSCPSPIRVLVVPAPEPPTRDLFTQQGRRRRDFLPKNATELCRHLRLLLAVASQSIWLREEEGDRSEGESM